VIPAQEKAIALATQFVERNYSVRDAKQTVDNTLSGSLNAKSHIEQQKRWREQDEKRKAEALKVAPEDLAAAEKEARRKQLRENRERKVRLELAHRAVVEAITPEPGGQIGVDHLRLVAHKLNATWLQGETRKKWLLPTQEELEKAITKSDSKAELWGWIVRLSLPDYLVVDDEGRKMGPYYQDRGRGQVTKAFCLNEAISDALKAAGIWEPLSETKPS
jgi:hypothetical protein